MISTPRVFVASSGEALRVAKAIQQNLKSVEVRLWNQGAFNVSENVIDDLGRNLKHSDFGIFVFAADDEASIRGQRRQIVRDNVVLELGMFIGHLGKERSFIVRPEGAHLHLPTDLVGVVTANYDSDWARREPVAALGDACTQIEDALKRQHRRRSKELSKTVSEALETICWSMSAPLTPERATLRAFLFKQEKTDLVCVGFWDPYESVEHLGLSFRIDDKNASKVVVVRCLLDNSVKRTSQTAGSAVSPLASKVGVKGEVKDDLRYVLAAPIRNENDTIWGVVDFDASNNIGKRLLQNEPAANAVILRLARDLAKMLAH
jgi:hypothetical protein